MSSSQKSDTLPEMPRIASAPNIAASDPPVKKLPHISSKAELVKTIVAITGGERDNLKLIGKVNDRMQRVGLTMPGVEVRWSNLVVEMEPPRQPISQALRRSVAGISTTLFSTASSPGASSPAATTSNPPAAAPPSTAARPAASRGPCSSTKPRRALILNAGSGCLQPGRMCLLLGPPGAGRTTLLKALAGQLIPPAHRRSGGPLLSLPSCCSSSRRDDAAKAPPPVRAGRIVQHGTVWYNGMPADGSTFEVARAASYVGQTELHLPELTVAETLNFAAECQGQQGVERLRTLLLEKEAAAGIAPNDVHLEQLLALSKGPMASDAVVEIFARMLGIDHVMQTSVGNEMITGISGGQKRRVTCGEMAVGLCQVMMLDEVTNGLDAAAALAIVRALRNMCELANMTILATLLQPSPDVVDCFHHVMLISASQLLYHGPRDGLLPYFRSMGLAPLPGQSVADFVQEVLASPQDQARYRVAPPPLPPSLPPPPPVWSSQKWVSPKRMRAVFETSELGREMGVRLAMMPYSHPLQDLVLRKERYGTGTAKMWLAVLRREMILALRNKAFFAAGLYQVLLTGFLVSTAFVRLKHASTNDANLFMSVMFFSLMTLFMAGFNFGPIYCYRLGVFYKQRDHRFYSPASYALASVILRLPDVVIQAVSYSIMVYFSVGFTMEAGRFFLFLANMLLAGLNSATTFTLLASVMRNESATQGLGAVCLMVSTLVSGFPIAPGSIPGWWIWIYWLMPMSWNFRSMVVTEMTSKAWAPVDPRKPDGLTMGLASLDMRGIPSDFKWVWAGLGMVAGMSLLQVALQVLALTYLGPLRSSGNGPEHDNDDDHDANEPLRRASRGLENAPPPPQTATAAAAANGKSPSSTTTIDANLTSVQKMIRSQGDNGVDVGDHASDAGAGAPGAAGSSPSPAIPVLNDLAAELWTQEGSSSSPWTEDACLNASATKATTTPVHPLSPQARLVPSPTPAPAALGGGSDGVGKESLLVRPPALPQFTAAAAGMGQTAASGGGGGGTGGAVLLQMNLGGSGGELPAVWDARSSATAAAAANGDQVLKFKPVVMAFRNVSYFVRPSGGDKKELQLLDGVRGVFRPGVLTSLMGASGAGKTTLMDVLAGRKTGGRTEGEQVVDGAPKHQSTFTRLMGYVEQLDVHNPHATVEEALLFSARLRVSSDLLPASNARAFVRHMMEVVELGPLAHHLIGLGGPSGGLSTEARKRLTIAVELVANPSIVFMDEPTTGLDARAAGLVMRAVRNTVATGRTVVCTIHQPNREIMDCFDELLLLKPGGRTIFFGPLGPRQSSLVSYLSAVRGVRGYEAHMNPAEWMLEVTSSAAEQELGLDFGTVWEGSEPARVANSLIDEHCSGDNPRASATAADDVEAGQGRQRPAAESSNKEDEEEAVAAAAAAAAGARRYAQPTHMQLWLVLRRGIVSQCRNSAYNGMRFVIAFALSWILGSLYWGRGKERNSVVGLMDIMGVIFSGALFLPMTNLMMIMPQVMNERAVFYREKASGMYHPAVFAAVQSLSEMPFVFLESVLYVVIMYFTIQFEFMAAKVLWFWLYIWLALMICTLMGMGFMNLAPNMPAAIAGCSGLILLWNLFCGFLISRKNIKPWYLWAYYGNPITYIIYGCVTTQLGDVWDEQVALGDGNAVPVAAFTEESFSYHYSMRGWMVLILIGFLVVFRIASYFGITRLNFQNR